MKQAELQVGNDYAFPTYKPYDGAPLAARVRVLSVDGRGKATVQVIDPGIKAPTSAWGATPVKSDERKQISTRDIACPWEEWKDLSASIYREREAQKAAQRDWRANFEAQRADRLVVDVARALPAKYDEERTDPDSDAEERNALCQRYIRARGLGPYATVDSIKPLLVDLPVLVLRDILAAMTGWRLGEAAPDTVATTFRRSAELLDAARIAASERGGRTTRRIPQPGHVLGPSDVAFIYAMRESVAASGGKIVLPIVPPLPEWVDEAHRAMAPTLGWLRVAIADTGGRLVHSPGCRSVCSEPVLQCDHLPWWQIMLESPEHLCSVCDGPSIRDLAPLAGFVAAVDVWRDRGQDRIERWQQAACYRLLAATAMARAEALEPDVTLTSVVVNALVENPPTQDGWMAYATVRATQWNRLNETLERVPSRQRKQARLLALDCLTTLEDALPSEQRPERLPDSAEDEVLRQRYKHLQDLLHNVVPNLDRLLFTLPAAQ